MVVCSPSEGVETVLVHEVDGAKLEEHEVHEGSLRRHRPVHLSSLAIKARSPFATRTFGYEGFRERLVHETNVDEWCDRGSTFLAEIFSE